MAEPEPKLDLLIKLLMLTTSANDAEALAAMRKANNLLSSRIKSDWNELLRGKVTIVEDPFNAISTPDPRGGETVAPKRPAPAPPKPPPPPPPPKPPDPYAGLTPIYHKNTYHIREKLRALPGAKYNANAKTWYVYPYDVNLVRKWLGAVPPRTRRGPATVADLAEDLGI